MHATLLFLRVLFMLGIVFGVLPARAKAQELFLENFENGIKSWNIESGDATWCKGDGAHLLLRSEASSPGEISQGIVAREISGLKSNTDYDLTLSFRFEKNFPDTWPWAAIEVWKPGTTLATPASEKLAAYIIRPQKQADLGYEDVSWREVTISFNSGNHSSIIIRLKNHPKMKDQTHWDSIQLQPR